MANAAGSSTAAERILISWTDKAPANKAHSNAVAHLGAFTKQPQLVNGHPCYVHEGRADVMLWCDPKQYWSIGTKGDLGTFACSVYCRQTGVPLPENLTGVWAIYRRGAGGAGLIFPPDAIKVTILPSASSSDTDVTITGARTREERDAAGRKRAIDVESEQVRKQAKTALETHVAEARSTCDKAIAERAASLGHAAVLEYFADKIDEDELKRRKKAAREQAVAEHEALSALDKAYGAYTAATAARVAAEKALVAAEKALDTALKAEDEAADKVEELAITMMAAQNGARAGPSGVVKSEVK